ncbi:MULTISPECIES: hypothetical protein [unclassified Tenacibaculum]|uniref:hypothetical protein n=1 Tax=unclassified Tenacibaculum TaxID=2635139 RepID=UPI001F2DFE89|nr:MULTISPECIES: hypothetical protein [unclassified Tenacibaculum]MCF2874630.1 hypothetical protein [Tenacibaculum sp. Cn5-1]MCF2934304.1 hypothetical protein [Tenacibaculum sp. Cn5-34]MCG7510514.1 hypothetical protein [Tenacibaculum sp. Cn5-46]
MKNLKSLRESLTKIANSKELSNQELKEIKGGGNIGDWFATLEECKAECWGADWWYHPTGGIHGESAICTYVGNGYECDHDS